MTRKFFGVAALLSTSFGSVAVAAAPPADLRAQADALMASACAADGPGAAAIVTRGGETIYTGRCGLADVEARRPVTPDTVFRLGSITKQFAAAVILQLVDERKVSLDDPLSRFFPDYPQPGASATVRQLLNHTSGIQSYTDIPGWMADDGNISRPATTEQMIDVFRGLPSPTPPGQAWDYNNSGYVLIGAIIEKVTGKPWYQAIEERISAPLRLRSIGYGIDREGRPGMARGYTLREGRVQRARPLHMSVPHAAGALVGTVGDLAKWAHALHHGRVVSPALYTAMTTPASLPEGRTVPYGFGLGFDQVRGRPTIGHNGGISGSSTDSLYIPSEDLFVAVFTNSDEAAVAPSIVARRLAALTLGEPFASFTPAAVAAETLAPLLGVYRIGETGVSRRFFTRDGKLYAKRDGGPEQEVFAAGDDRFFYGPHSLTWFRIDRRGDGAHVMEMHQNGATQTEPATRSGDIPPEPVAAQVNLVVLQTYVGRYQTAGPAAEIALRGDGVLTIQLTGQPAIPLRPTSDTEFTVVGVDARVVFHRENGAVGRFVIHQGGQELEARRVVP